MRTTLSVAELNKRAEKVFVLDEGDFIWDVEVRDDGRVIVNMEEVDEDGDIINFDYEPNMEDRPEALDYLLGKRDDFND